MIDFLIPSAFAQQGGAPSPGGGGTQIIFLFGTLFLIWWFLILRPQNKAAKAHAAMVAGLKKGDVVVTSAGIHGRVAAVEERVVQIEVDRGVKLRVDKDKIARAESASAAADKASDDKGEKGDKGEKAEKAAASK